MATSLLLLLKGPMQSWGDGSRYRQRTTGQIPTKSGIVGLLAAAEGRRRADPIEDLASLKLAVRVDQPGSLLRDYQTSQAWQTGGRTALVSRYYLSDAVFVAAVESSRREVIEGLAEALANPRYPLFLGRRSCPAPAGLVLDVKEAEATEALRSVCWQASDPHRRTRATEVELPIYRDAMRGEDGSPRQDVPISFSQEHRRYGWREVVLEKQGVKVDNQEFGSSDDPFFEAVVSA